MKEYKLVHLNKGLKWSIEQDIEQAQEVINRYVNEGWELQQILAPSNTMGTIIAVFWKEKGV